MMVVVPGSEPPNIEMMKADYLKQIDAIRQAGQVRPASCDEIVSLINDLCSKMTAAINAPENVTKGKLRQIQGRRSRIDKFLSRFHPGN